MIAVAGSEKNWIRKEDGTSEIECWGIVWATRKFRCYLDRHEFDLYTDHKALTWVFNETNHSRNAKVARWVMELAQLRLKVYHKPGTAMGHVDGLSRLHSQMIGVLSMANLLNDVEDGRGNPVPVGELHAPNPAAKEARALGDFPGGPTDDHEPPKQLLLTPVDIFGLQQDRFVEEQMRTPWIPALIAFLKNDALALDPQLSTNTILMAPHYSVKNGVLMRKVHLIARAGPAQSLQVPLIPLPFISTLQRHCHSGVLAAHIGVNKTLDKVRKHA
ncbi:hypothetical protein PC128_g25325 [Phytophthora cactorum]|nr:hypothetical protein PC128_g25325 [Phytophthora cactorum]